MDAALPETAVVKISLEPQSVNQGTHNGDEGGTSGWIDTAGFDRAEVEFLFGLLADTLTQVDMQVFENDAQTGFGTQISGALVESDHAEAEKQPFLIDVRLGGRANRKRYIRPRLITGPTGAALVAITVRLYAAHAVPVTQDQTPVMV